MFGLMLSHVNISLFSKVWTSKDIQYWSLNIEQIFTQSHGDHSLGF